MRMTLPTDDDIEWEERIRGFQRRRRETERRRKERIDLRKRVHARREKRLAKEGGSNNGNV